MFHQSTYNRFDTAFFQVKSPLFPTIAAVYRHDGQVRAQENPLPDSIDKKPV